MVSKYIKNGDEHNIYFIVFSTNYHFDVLLHSNHDPNTDLWFRMSSYLLAPFRYILVDYFKSLADPRIKDYFVIRNGLLPTFTILAIYLLISLSYGKRFMCNRKPYNLTKLMFIYNVFMASFNLYAFYRTIFLSNYFHDFVIVRAPDPRDVSQREMDKIYYGYLYLGTKYLDLFGKLFFYLIV